MPRLSSHAARYGISLIATALASLLYFWSGPVEVGSDVHYFGFALAVLLSALAGGLGPGLLATGLSALASSYLLLAPIYSFEISSHDHFVRLLLFGGEGVLLSCVGHIFREADISDYGAGISRYLPVLLFVSTATGLKLLAFKDVERALPFTFYYVAIAASAWTGGLGPGLAATFLSALLAGWLFVMPESSASFWVPVNAARLVLFVLEGSLIAGLGAAYPGARRLAKKAAQQMRQHSQRMRRSLQDVKALRLTSNDLIWEWDLVSNRVTAGATRAERPETPVASMRLASWLDQIHPEDRGAVAVSLDSVLKQRRDDWTCEYRRMRSGGESDHILDRAYIIRDLDGNPTRVVGRSVDLTDAKHLSRAYRAQKPYRMAFEQSPLAILVTDDALRITSANIAASAMLGYSNPELKDKHIESLFHPSRREAIMHRLLGLTREKSASAAFQEQCEGAEGDLFKARINAASLEDVNSGSEGFVITIEKLDAN
jgi:PAS domain S-box-containing protein